MQLLKLALAAALALLPSPLKIPVYRVLFGYRIGKGVRIGFSPFVGVSRCSIGDGTRIGTFNLFYGVGELDIGRQVRIGFFNLIRGGRLVRVGDYCSVLRQNVMNAIIDGDFLEPVEATLTMGTGASVASGHWLDFSSGIEVGAHSMIAGRNSSLWSHFRQKGGPVRVGEHSYIGSEARVTPDSVIPPLSIVAIGSVLLGQFDRPRALIGGNPAGQVRSLNEFELVTLIRKTRRDIPDRVVLATLPPDLHELFLVDARSREGERVHVRVPDCLGA